MAPGNDGPVNQHDAAVADPATAAAAAAANGPRPDAAAEKERGQGPDVSNHDRVPAKPDFHRAVVVHGHDVDLDVHVDDGRGRQGRQQRRAGDGGRVRRHVRDGGREAADAGPVQHGQHELDGADADSAG